ncbi:fimbrial chaperone [Acinetobacter colistiniresistens]|uniref:Fimbrial chaperone n=2 Tax=Acinetobacter colistiniresistens TaxID=280145 RepID=S3TZ01_9GAMM|nr:fimbrial chaperone [Acinetobacter colistiniresistens]
MSMKLNLNPLKMGLHGSLLMVSTLFASSTAFAQATFLIWPIYPKIEENEKAAAVWLQNTGKSDAMVQIRVFKWNQNNQQDAYDEQTEIIPSPPVARIKAGEKHMLRLTKAATVVDGKEQAYRIIVDELPVKLNPDADKEASKVSFQMRYSIPLFAYGKGLGSGLTEASQKTNLKNPLAKPVLSWWVKNNAQGKPELYIKNSGLKFSRLSGIKLSPASQQMALGNAAFGYILAQSTMKFDLDANLLKSLNSQSTLYGVDSSGVKQELIEIRKEG